jgi:hypothetical protein
MQNLIKPRREKLTMPPLVHQPSESAGHDGTVKSSRLDSMDVEVAVQMKPRKRTAEEKPESSY